MNARGSQARPGVSSSALSSQKLTDPEAICFPTSGITPPAANTHEFPSYSRFQQWGVAKLPRLTSVKASGNAFTLWLHGSHVEYILMK